MAVSKRLWSSAEWQQNSEKDIFNKTLTKQHKEKKIHPKKPQNICLGYIQISAFYQDYT